MATPPAVPAVVPPAAASPDVAPAPDAEKKPPKKKKINVTPTEPQSESKTLPGSGRHGIEILAGYGFSPSFNAPVGGGGGIGYRWLFRKDLALRASVFIMAPSSDSVQAYTAFTSVNAGVQYVIDFGPVQP
ncbi:MAG: hypothetical protein WC889_11655, partial [Myxococcota bacterium]